MKQRAYSLVYVFNDAQTFDFLRKKLHHFDYLCYVDIALTLYTHVLLHSKRMELVYQQQQQHHQQQQQQHAEH